MIVQRRADQLQPGDITNYQGYRRIVVLVNRTPGACPEIWSVPLGAIEPAKSDTLRGATDVDVEVPDLTPARARAEELLDLLENANSVSREWTDRVAAVLVELRPKPVTLEEALAVLANLEPKLATIECADGDRRIRPALDLVERARRHGMLDK